MRQNPFHGARISAKQEFFAENATQITEISADQYAWQRKIQIPDAMQPEKPLYDYFATYGSFYMADDCLFAVSLQDETAYFQEFSGDTRKLPEVVAALGAKSGIVLTPDNKTPVAMICRFTPGNLPDYFSFALD